MILPFAAPFPTLSMSACQHPGQPRPRYLSPKVGAAHLRTVELPHGADDTYMWNVTFLSGVDDVPSAMVIQIQIIPDSFGAIGGTMSENVEVTIGKKHVFRLA